MSDREAARRIAGAVRFEARRAYRAGPAGVYVPPGFTATGEPSFARAECLLDGGKVLRVRSRFLHLQGPEEPPGDGAAEREIEADWPVAGLLAGERVRDTRFPGHETGLAHAGEPLDVRIRASAERLPGPYGALRLRFRLENTSGWTGDDRAGALRRSLVAAYTFLEVAGGSFVSLTDPPEWARPATEGCENLHAWPVPVDDDLVLVSPIDPENLPGVPFPGSPGREAGAACPEAGPVTVRGREVGKGSKVLLRPAGRADAQDMFVAGRVATVEAVLLDVDGSRHLAVTIDDDPGADLRRAQSRFWYFAPGDVEPL